MVKRFLVIIALVVAAVPARLVAGADEPAYLTIVNGRGFWDVASNCVPHGDDLTVDLGEVAAELDRRGMAGYVTVVGEWTRGSRHCPSRGEIYASWSDLARLRDVYGWTVGSNGDTLNPMTDEGSTLAEQWQTSCGAYRKLRAHGHHDGWALFSYPLGGGPEDISDEVQDAVVKQCFGFGRVYTDDLPYRRNQRAVEGDPAQNPHWWQYTHNLHGGRCNDLSQPCSAVVKEDRFYDDPADLAAHVQPQPGEWSVLQYHAFVAGRRSAPNGVTWDCTDADWRRHWTSWGGIYCWDDFVEVLDAIPASVTVTDPATVATAWGRILPPPAITGVSPPSGPVAGGNTVTIAGLDFRAVGAPGDGFVDGRGFAVRFGTRAATVLSVTATAVTVRVPRAGSAGRVPITVVNADGLSVKLPGAYRYTG